MANKTLFRADIAKGLEGGKDAIDREAGIIRGYSVITKGEALGHDMEIDGTALDQVVVLGNKPSVGIKARFGHPNMSSEALGTFIGRAKSFRRDGDQVRADLHLDKTAHETPNGDLGGYVLGLAESDPEAFATSIVFSGEKELRLKTDGTRETDDKGDALLPLVRFKALYASDIVDEPAANENGFFGHKFFGADVKLSAEATGFLRVFLDKPDAVDKIIGFLGRYSNNETAGDVAADQSGGSELNKETENVLIESVAPINDRFEDGKKEGFESGVKEERARVLSISKEAFSFPVDVKTEALSAIERGENFDKALLAFKDKHLSALRSQAPAPSGPNADPDAEDVSDSLSEEEKSEKLWSKDANLRSEFSNNKAAFLAFQKADEAGLVRIKKS